ncbi:MAG: 5-(carboxyamino)imidazole ribonucleotide mutase [Deltaproteobacteria bacterium]|nr:5-(carboxyamino)imidazole ribonucleotide mutase [Deltaproteobacteria bacterium]
MGSANDWDVMECARDALKQLGVETDVRVISAHRTPERLVRFLETAEAEDIGVVICGAGMSAHLAGVTAAHTLLPVLGVPIDSSPLNGLDALLSTVQMPGGIPVATFGIGRSGAKNAGHPQPEGGDVLSAVSVVRFPAERETEQRKQRKERPRFRYC